MATALHSGFYRFFCLVVHVLIVVVLFCYWFDFFENRDTALHAGILRHIDALLNDTLRLSLSGLREDGALQDRLPVNLKSSGTPPSAGSLEPIAPATSRAQLCQSLQGRTVHLVGPRETLYQLHTYLLKVLHLHPPRPNTTRVSCPGPLSCPFHALCYPLSRPLGSGSGSGSAPGPLTPADVASTNTSLLRFVYSSTLHPSPTRDDPRFRLPFVDPRTDVRVIDSRWVTQVAASRKKADVVVLSRAPLPAPAWSYNASRGDWTWLRALRGLEQQHAETLAHHLFADVLSRLDYLPTEPNTQRRLLLGTALHSTVSTFLPSLLLNLEKLREHAGHRAILGEKAVLWYGSWFQPVSCALDHVSTLLSSEPDPRRLLLRLLAQAEATDNPWSAYYNAQVYMHEQLLAELLPKYGIIYISSLSTVIPLEVGRTYKQAEGWSCIQRVFETPHGTLMGQKFLGGLLGALSSWDFGGCAESES
ncbi:hypothetical protein BJY52DRAFT_478241 [Lactarius psammicola]|nr:hypothetical protein BJY52DRAFT_478241 [Lactarius psammicola]